MYYSTKDYLKNSVFLVCFIVFFTTVFSIETFGQKVKTKKKAKLPPENLVGAMLTNAQYNFSPSNLNGATLSNPTSLQFGPDGRLYVSEQGGIIKAFKIVRNALNTYTVSSTEIISQINTLPNHNDDGILNASISTRQITGILVKGTATNPVIYVSSSDSRIGGPSGTTNLDTNSGIISLLSWNGSTWVKTDLVRGLPRSEENHANNGLQIDAKTNILYVAHGGHTNAGSPSTNFDFTCEYALSAAILSIDLNAINAMPLKGSGNTAYKYDLPTLDDPTRANNADGTDAGDPFGGNNGLNQAKIVPGGPVQIYSPGYRNAYDIVITKSRKMYTIDNGANQGWGGYPQFEGTPNVNNNYLPGEPGSSSPSATQQTINNLDNLHYIGNIDTYKPGSFYGGHPNPLRANPAGAGLYTFDGTSGVWRTSKTGANPLPVDWPPVPVANPVEANFRMPGVADSALLTFSSSTNGIAEYTASNFSGALQGSLLAASYNGQAIVKISLNSDGTQVTNSFAASNHLDQDVPFASNFGSDPLDITTQGDGEVFQGSVWCANYTSGTVTVFEPQGYSTCTGLYNTADDDGDHFTNADEIDNATNPCSAASMPPDNDHDFISDLNDPDDDNDGIPDTNDLFALDASNGRLTTLPVTYDLFNNSPGTGLFGLGFTGLMSNAIDDYNNLFIDSNLIAGGAVGAFTVVGVTPGDALGSLNNQENAFQFGIKAGASPYTIQSRMLGPFFNNKTPQGFQSQGIFIGTGDQNNYLKITLNANGGPGGIEVVYENAGVASSTQYPLSGSIPTSTLELFLSVNPIAGTIQPKYSINGGQIITLGSPVKISGALLSTLQGNTAYAVGVISTSRGASPFTATWDYMYVSNDAVTATGMWQTVVPASGAPTAREENAYVEVGNKFYLLGGRSIMPVQVYNPLNKSWANMSAPPIELHHFEAVNLNGLIYAAGAFTGAFPHETPVPQIYMYNPASDKWIAGSTIPVARRRGSPGAVAYKNKIYMVGGITDGHWAGWVNWFDVYDPATNSWSILPNAPHARDHFHAVVLNDKLYVTGGRRSSASTNQTFSLTVPEVDVYDFSAGQWSTLPAASNLPIPRAGTGVGVIGNEIIVIGGEDTTQTLAHKETHALDVTTNTWRRLADLQQGRHGTQAVVSNDGIYTASGAGNQGSSNLLTSQEAFYMFSPTTPNTDTLSAGKFSSPASLSFGTSSVGSENSKVLTISNTGGNQDLLVSSITLNGSAFYSYTSPYPLPFIIPVNKSVNIIVTFKPTSVGSQTANLVINHSGPAQTATTILSGMGEIDNPVYRINAGGPPLTNSIGKFSADTLYSPAPGNVFTTTNAIGSTSDQAIYQTERFGSNGVFSYAFPVTNGSFKVVLHFAELYWLEAGKRLFDVNIEGNKVLDNYDIFKKAGAFTATTETFPVTVTDGTLNIDFSSLASDGGIDQPKVSAIEIISVNSPNVAPVASAGSNQTITLPANSAVLDGSASSDSDGTVASYAWSQSSGPNTASFNPNTTAQKPTVTGLVAGTYVFSLTVTDNLGTLSKPATVSVTVSNSTTTVPAGTPVYRVNAGGPQLTNSIGKFSADTLYSPAPGNVYSVTSTITGTTNGTMYQTERYGTNGTFNYAFPVSNGSYSVVLHFSELYWTAAGKRLFDVNIEGNKVLDNYDIFKKAGAFTATTETFPVTVTDGTLNIDFSSLASDGGIDQPKVSAIEIISVNSPNVAPVASAGSNQTITLPANSAVLDGSASSDSDGTVASYAWSQSSGPNTASFNPNTTAQKPTVTGLVAGTYVFSLTVTDNLGTLSKPATVSVTVSNSTTTVPAGTPVYRVNAGGPQLTNSIGKFSADTLYSPAPGNVYSVTSTITGTTNGTMYQTERYGTNGTFNYAFPVSNGSYSVVLHFSELYWTAAGKRLFDVNIEGNKVLDNYDIFKKAGAFTATTETFPVTVTDGTLNIDFSSLASDGGIDQPKVSAIEIISVNSPNVAPVASAGSNQTITLPANSAVLDGSASSDSDGTVASYAWSQSSGPNTASFNPNTTAQKPTVTGLVAGTYVFSLTVTDNLGALSKPATVSVTVNATPNKVPVANAGANQTITLPANSVVLDGSGSVDSDGAIASYNWSQSSGPNTATFSPATSVQKPTVSGLIAGTYMFNLSVTDNSGAVSNPVSVTISVIANTNKIPVANAGANQTITLPANSVVLDGSGSVDSDGAIASYNWSQSSGPNTATFSPNTTAQKPTVSGLIAGTYVFNLSVTDNLGAVSSPVSVTISVLKKKGRARVIADSVAITANSNNEVTIEKQLKADSIEKTFKAYPNPNSSGQYTILLPKQYQGQVFYNLMSFNGTRLAGGSMLLKKPTSLINFNFSSAMTASGQYYLILEGKELRGQVKLMHLK